MTEAAAAPARPRGLARGLAALIRFYQLAVSPLLRPSCRFAPTCSQYAYEALTEHGAIRGSWLAVRRLLRCHPFCDGGYDPVPPTKQNRSSAEAVTDAGSLPVSASISAASSTSQEAGERLC